MNNTIKNIVMGLVFILSIVLIFVGQRNIGYTGLVVELIGLAGIIGTLFVYNRRYK